MKNGILIILLPFLIGLSASQPNYQGLYPPNRLQDYSDKSREVNNRKREAISGFYTTRFGRRSDPMMKEFESEMRAASNMRDEEESNKIFGKDKRRFDNLFEIIDIGEKIKGHDEKGTKVYCVFVGVDGLYICEKLQSIRNEEIISDVTDLNK